MSADDGSFILGASVAACFALFSEFIIMCCFYVYYSMGFWVMRLFYGTALHIIYFY